MKGEMGKSIKFLQFSDVHEEDDVNLPRYKALVRLAEREQVDAMLALGDFFDDQVVKEARKRQRSLSEKIEAHFGKTVLRDVGVYQSIGQLLQRFGSLGVLKHLVEVQEDEDVKEQFRRDLEYYEQNQGSLEQSFKTYSEDRWLSEQETSFSRELAGAELERNLRIGWVLNNYACPKLGVRGNHDSDFVYRMPGITWVEHEDVPVQVAGFRFVGAPNTYEVLQGMPSNFYNRLEQDPAEFKDSNQVANFIQKHGTREDLEAYIASLQANQPAFPVSLKEKLPVHNRLKGTKADWVLTHKAPGVLADRYGSGTGLDFWMQEAKPKIVSGGHVHEGLFSDANGYAGIRSGDESVFVVHADNETKKIERISVYEWTAKRSAKKKAA